jgi:hypothetical protein
VLSSLGHVDLSVDLERGRPASWAISPPTLVSTTCGGAALTGVRSDALVKRLYDDVAALGGDVYAIENASSPATMLVRGLDDEEVADLAASLAGALRIDVLVNAAGGAAIAAMLPSLAEVERALPPMSWPAVELERFDLDRNKWERIGALDSTGAYKFATRPLRYGFVPSKAVGVISADNRLVKWLAARASGRNLLAYDSAHELLVTRLGAQLPGLYERAAVLCSGRPPMKRVDGTVTYEGVPPEVAATLYQLLCK